MAYGLSAVKLEKAIMNLELRLREEFRKDVSRQVTKQIKPYVQQINALQSQVDRLSARSASKSSSPPQPSVEPEHGVSELLHVDLDTLLTEGDGNMDESLSGNSDRALPCVSIDIVDLLQKDPDHPGTKPPSEMQRQKTKVAIDPSLGLTNDSLHPELVEEPVAFLETAWNLVLVLGHTNCGRVDLVIACLLWLGSGLMQISFFFILLSDDFLGEPFGNQVEVAKAWRESIAHDFKHMDLNDESLVSRVCRADRTLILSTSQMQMLDQINAFLGLGKDEFQAPYFQPGILLCMMCILLWCLYLLNEFRLVIFSLEAVSQVPRGPRTQWKRRGGFQTISYGRFGVYCFMRLARFFIAVGLLYAGVQWLSGTISITELILNAVALSAVLQIDEMVFAALMPKKIQICIQDLEAIKVPYSKARSQTESIMLLVGITCLMLWPWMYNVGPLSWDMLEVKRQYCGGTQNFVVAGNQVQGVTVGLVTLDHAQGLNQTSLTRFAVSRHIWQEPLGTSNYIRFTQDRSSFVTARDMDMHQRNLHDSLCMDFDNIFLGNATHELQEFYRQYFYSASYEAGIPEGASCAEMAHLCHSIDTKARLVRHVCPRTCDCHLQHSNPLLKLVGEGCSKACFTEQEYAMRFSPCEDMNLEESPHLREAWEGFWDSYKPLMEQRVGMNFSSPSLSFVPDFLAYVKQVGCPGLGVVPTDPVTRSPWCSGSQYYGPLANWCPRTCGCHTSETLPWWCPRSCEGCKDTANFPTHIRVSDCAQSLQTGLCEAYPLESAVYCAETCNLCSALHNNGTID
ncbi:unnamed protein product [Symbiodinium natans]|uniref:ShKT domain-containing protein n=1 Tax=Symbiodinium natans TaxID=878477 RepID=A0A812UFB7_9DINO|nr:unnamed protein product [Symbiodinium natans]